MKQWQLAFKARIRPETKRTREDIEVDKELLERLIARSVDYNRPILEEIKRLQQEAEKHLLFFSLGTVHGIYLHLRRHGQTKLGFRPQVKNPQRVSA